MTFANGVEWDGKVWAVRQEPADLILSGFPPVAREGESFLDWLQEYNQRATSVLLLTTFDYHS